MFRGQKWLMSARYLSDAAVAEAWAKVREARAAGFRGVGVSAPSYIGEPSPVVRVDYNGGSTVYGYIYQ